MDTKYQVNAGFFDSINNDRLYSAEEMNRPYKRVITNGIFATPKGTPSTDLQVFSANSGMNVIVKKGEGLIGDKWYENPTDLTITISSNSDIVPRVDSIIAQVDKLQNGRVGNIVYRTGAASSNPLPPAINTNENIVEMRLANIYVSPTANWINQDAITDLRGSAECPWITSLIKQVDTSTLYDQWRAAYQKYYDDETEAFNAFMETLTSQLTVNTNITKYESHYKTTSNGETVIPINILAFNKNKDVLMVRVNKLFASESDYTISSDSSTITLTKDLFAGNDVDFLVLQSVVVGDTATVMQAVEAMQDTINDIRITSASGGVKLSITNTSTNVLEAFVGLGTGFHTIYAAYGVQGLPVVGAYRLFGHITGAGYGWLIAVKADGSTWGNYLDNGTWQGWKVYHEKTPVALYKSTNGVFPNNDVEITPTKSLSECQHGWELVFTGYDDTSSTGRDQYVQTIRIPKRSYKDAAWNGETFVANLTYGYTAASGVIQTCFKSFNVFDNKIVSTSFNSQGNSRNMVLRAIFEY